MRLIYHLAAVVFFISITACSHSRRLAKDPQQQIPAHKVPDAGSPSANKTFTKPVKINREEFVAFAKTLLGTPYKYGSATPANGLDCSGFVTYVFAHFNVKCPRTSVAFTNEGKEIDARSARPGDLVLFTGSDYSTGIVGHMGIITATEPVLQFIHAASGKNIGVIVNSLTGYYKTHFVKVIRILE